MRGGNRRRRAGTWIAGLAVIAAIAATYQLTRPPALVWWTSPPIGNTGRRLKVLIPNGCALTVPYPPTGGMSYEWEGQFLFHQIETPRFRRWFIHSPHEEPLVAVHIYFRPLNTLSSFDDWYDGRLDVARLSGGEYQATRYLLFRETRIAAGVVYNRFTKSSFDATYLTICNSLRIE